MELRIIEICTRVATPLGIAGLSLAILYLVYLVLLRSQLLSKVGPGSTYRIVNRVITYVFILALIAVILGLGVNILYRQQSDLQTESPDTYLRAGQIYLTEQNLNAAEREFEKALDTLGKQNRRDATVASTHYLLGLSHWQMYLREKQVKLLDKAIDNYADSLDIDDSSWLTHSKLGLAYKEKGSLNDAEREYKIAMRLNTQQSNPPYMLARIYSLKNDYIEARRMLERAIELDSSISDFVWQESDFRGALSNEQFRKAVNEEHEK